MPSSARAAAAAAALAAVTLLAAVNCCAAKDADALATKVRKMNLTASSYATNYTVDLDDGLGPQTVIANFTIVSDPTEASPELPLLIHMNGFNVLPAYHSRLVAELAKQGYTVVMTDVALRANPNVNTPQRSALADMPRQGCNPLLNINHPGLTTLFYSQLDSISELEAMKNADPSKLVLMGHSFGGVGALATNVGCINSTSGQPYNASAGALFCKGYDPLNGTELLGAVVFESFLFDPLVVDPSRFVLYMGGAQSASAPPTLRFGYSLTTATGSKPEGNLTALKPDERGCVAYVQIDGMNHFGLNDYFVSELDGQISQCASPIKQPAFHPRSIRYHNEGLSVMGRIIGNAVRAAVLDDKAAKRKLGRLVNGKRVDQAFMPTCMLPDAAPAPAAGRKLLRDAL